MPFVYLIVDSIKNTRLNNTFKTKFDNERLQYTRLKQSTPTSETGWLCVGVDSVAQRHEVSEIPAMTSIGRRS